MKAHEVLAHLDALKARADELELRYASLQAGAMTSAPKSWRERRALRRWVAQATKTKGELDALEAELREFITEQDRRISKLLEGEA